MHASISFPNDLPVVQAKNEIQQAIRDNQVVIVAGETGSGKTTQLPKMLLELGYGRTEAGTLIGHTQPRRLAARSVAQRIADELQTPLGEKVGFKVRFQDQTAPTTAIKLVTDGMLLAELQNDRLLKQYDALIIDEAHERSLNIDFLLGVVAKLLPQRPDLKLIITSATIETERFAKHFGNAPVISVSGRTYPVEVRYRPLEGDEDSGDVVQGVCDAALELYREASGDILVFASGEREIRDFAEALGELDLPNTELLPLFARLSAAEQNRVFQAHSQRRIVIATNVAETSLTVPGIRYVIDPGTARISRYSYRTKVQRLPIEKISQASANQRMGRCGRVAPGICIRLYSEEDFLQRAEYTEPEILRTNLAAVILQMTAAKLGDIRKFPFIDRPDERFIKDGMNLLQELHAVRAGGQRRRAKRGGKKGYQGPQLTSLGRQLAQLPIDPRLGRMVLAAREFGCVREVMVITAALSIQDPRERPQQAQQKADEAHQRFHDKDSDFMSYLKLWDYLRDKQRELSKSQFRKQLKSEFLHFLRVREWQDVYSQIRQTVRGLGFSINEEPASYEAVHRALLSGLLSHVGNKQEGHEFLGARNRKFFIFPGSGLFKKPPKWVMAAELVETSRLFARVNAKLEPEWIEPAAQHLVKRNYFEPHFAKKSGSVVADEQVTLYGLIVVPRRRVQYGPVNPHEARQIFIREALVNAELRRQLPFIQHNQQLITEIRELEDKSRRRDILVDDEALFQAYDAHIPEGIYNEQLLAGWWHKASKSQPRLLFFKRDDLMAQSAEHVTELDYPDTWTQGEFTLPLSYHFEPNDPQDGVAVHVPLTLVNQIQPDGFDWQVPALREPLVIAWIKSLPKSLRRHFVPAPNYAQAFLQESGAKEALKRPLLASLTDKLRRMSGVTIPEEAWDEAQLPDYLRMRFVVEDDKGKPVADGRDLVALQQQLQGRVQHALRKAVADEPKAQIATDWEFGQLPEVRERQQRGYAVKAYPALEVTENGVRETLFDKPEQAALAHQKALRRLLQLQLPSPMRYLQQNLSNKAKLAMYYNPWGKVDALIEDCIQAALDEFIAAQPIRDEGTFRQVVERARGELNERVTAIAEQVEPCLLLTQKIRKQLKGTVTLEQIQAHGDIKAQLEQLVYPGFVSESGAGRVSDIERYLKAIERRLEKLPVDPNRDRLHMLTLEKLEKNYLELKGKWPQGLPYSEELLEIRWMLEELRVSFFAQQLGTRYPISEKRVQQALSSVKP